MSIREIKPGVFLIRRRKTLSNGQIKNAVKTFTGSKKEAKRIDQNLANQLEKHSSLKKPVKTVKDALDYYLSVKSDLSWQAIRAAYDRLVNEIGHLDVTQMSFRSYFARFWLALDTTPSKRKLGNMISNSHKNRILKLINASLEMCRKHGFFEENPIYRCFDYHSELEFARDRVYSKEEINVLLEVMQERQSYLYWPFKFAIKNPIRKDDIRLLKRHDFNMIKPWVQFKPKKTQRGFGPKITTLIELDSEMIEYFHSIPLDCQFLFYRTIDGSYRDLGNYNTHWRSILRWAKAKRPDNPNFLMDVKWHDTKHNAITHMLDNGYTIQDLKNLGIQYNERLVDRYYHFDAEKVLDRKTKSVSKFGIMAQAVAQ